MRYDVIVVGAGPAGSTAARECAARGLSVLILDKAGFPRDKPCGGGVNLRAARLLPFTLEPVTERVVYGVRFSVRLRHRFTRYWPEPISYLTRRSRLDAFLVQQAMGVGATLREGLTVREVERDPARVVVRAGGEAFEARALVAADGANGLTARLAGVPSPRIMGVALEGNVTPPSGIPAPWHDAAGLNLASIPGGYGWVFPKGNHLNLGVGGPPVAGPSLRHHLRQLVHSYGFDPACLWGVQGYRLPVRPPGAPLAQGNVLLVGDAAGLVEPLSGEGIYAAIWSGRAAAAYLAAYAAGKAPDLSGYQAEVERGLFADMRVAAEVYDVFHRTPGLWMHVFQHLPIAWSAACRILRGDRTYTDAQRRLGAFRVILGALAFASRDRSLWTAR